MNQHNLFLFFIMPIGFMFFPFEMCHLATLESALKHSQVPIKPTPKQPKSALKISPKKSSNSPTFCPPNLP